MKWFSFTDSHYLLRLTSDETFQERWVKSVCLTPSCLLAAEQVQQDSPPPLPPTAVLAVHLNTNQAVHSTAQALGALCTSWYSISLLAWFTQHTHTIEFRACTQERPCRSVFTSFMHFEQSYKRQHATWLVFTLLITVNFRKVLLNKWCTSDQTRPDI